MSASEHPQEHSERGLSSAEAQMRLARDGHNEIPSAIRRNTPGHRAECRPRTDLFIVDRERGRLFRPRRCARVAKMMPRQER